MTHIIHNSRERRKRRTRAVLFGTAARPRISVYRSNKSIYAQAIDDDKRVTLAASRSTKETTGNKSAQAAAVGKSLAEILLKQKIKTAICDRGMYKFHGRVKALIDGVREAGVTV